MGARKTQAEAWYGGAFYLETLTGYGISPEVARVWTVKGTSGAAGVTLPDARTVLGTGWPVLIVVLTTDSTDVVLKDASGTTLATLVPDSVTLIGLLDGSTLPGVWCFTGEGDPRDYLAVFHGITDDSDVLRRYDPNLSTWQSAAAFTRDHEEWASTFVLPAGTSVVDGTVVSGDHDRYSAATDAWTVRTGRGNDCLFAPPAVEGGLAYLFSSGLTNGTADRHVDRYDESGDAWTSRNNMPETAAHGVSGSIEAGKILVGLGLGGFGVGTGELRNYTVSSDSYASEADHPYGDNQVHHAASFALESRLHVIGGSLFINQAARASNNSFDLTTRTWVSRLDYPQSIRRAGGTTDSEGELGYVCGGEDSGGSPTTQFRSYVLDTFRTLPVSPDNWGGDIEYQLRPVAKP
ncbi:MAG: hypothetical protein RL885_25115 [Planctomycetota bacterium]